MHLLSRFRGEPHCSTLRHMNQSCGPCQGLYLLMLPWLPILGVVQHTQESDLTQNCAVFFLHNVFPQPGHTSFSLVCSVSITSAPPSYPNPVSLSLSVNVCNLSPYRRLIWGRGQLGKELHLLVPLCRDVSGALEKFPSWLCLLMDSQSSISIPIPIPPSWGWWSVSPALAHYAGSLRSQGSICNITDKQEVYPEVPGAGDTDAG